MTDRQVKRLKRRWKRKLYRILLAMNNMDFRRLRPVFCLMLIAGVLLIWVKLPTTEYTNADEAGTVSAAELAYGIRTAPSVQDASEVDVVALFLSGSVTGSGETLYSFYLTGKELSYLAEGAITTTSKEKSLYLDGLNYTYHKNRIPLNRITSLSANNGDKIAEDSLYHVVSTEDIFSLFHYISYRSVGIMKIHPKDATGALLSDYQQVILTKDGTPLTMEPAALYTKKASSAGNARSVVTIQKGFNLIDLIKEPNRITVCIIALFIALIALIWYIVPRMHRIHVWFRIYRIRSKKRSSHTLYGIRRRY